MSASDMRSETHEFSWLIWLFMALALALCAVTVFELARYDENKVRQDLNRRFVGTVYLEPGLVAPRLG